MTHRYFLITLLALVLTFVGMLPSSAFQIAKTSNGLTVIIEEDHSVDLVAVDVWVKAGSGAETDKLSGISHLIEHMLYGATIKRKTGDMDLEMESIGATLDAHTSRDWAHFNTTVAKRYLPKALDVLADALKNAQFNKDELNREKLVILDEIGRKLTKPTMICKDQLAKELYGSHPYAMPIEGAPESIKRLTRDDISAYYHANYVPENMAVVVVGDIGVQEAWSLVEKAFSGYADIAPPRSKFPALLPPEKQVNKTLKAPFKNTYLAIGFLGPRSSDISDLCAVDVLLTHLGFGYRSWMTTILKDKLALAEEVSADFLTQKEPGMISLIAATKPDKTEKAKEAIIQNIQKLRKDGLSEGELASAKRSLIGQYAFDCETYAGRATSIGFYFAVADARFNEKYTSSIQAVTNVDVIRAATIYLDPEHAVILQLEPRAGGEK
ncbi:MAG: pitrilysin family protein [Armatimonadetes bacterium]|nr:pitrilysin family protein [Armatimonadota bacterium]